MVRKRDDIEASFRAYCFGVARMKRFDAARKTEAEAAQEALAALFGDDD